jgi:hypothetical protein
MSGEGVWRGASQRRAYSARAALFQRLIALAADPFRMQIRIFFQPERPLSARSESGAAFAPRAQECDAGVCLILLSH